MRLCIVILLVSIRSYGFSTYNGHSFKANWVFHGENISGIKKVNPLYFEGKPLDEQLDIQHWIRRVEQMTEVQKRRDDNVNKATLVGKVLTSVGDVRIVRKTGRVAKDARFLYEGDILETKATGSCWLVLLDGGLLRVSTRSSISISEVMFNENNFRVFVRINNGEVYFRSRADGDIGRARGDFFDFSFMEVLDTTSIEDILSYFGNTLYSSKKIPLNTILKMQKIYSNDLKFENWSLTSRYYFYNDFFFSSIPSSEAFFLVEDNKSYLKINQVFNKEDKAFFSEISYSEELNKEIKVGRWYSSDLKSFKEEEGIEGIDFFLKTITNNLTPFYFKRERFMKSYSYFYSNIDKFPLIKSLPQYWGKSLVKREDFVRSYFRRAEKSFQRVKASRHGERESLIITKNEYDFKYHQLEYRLLTLVKLKIVDIEKIINEKGLLFSSLKRVNEVIGNHLKRILLKLKNSEKNKEYISRQ